MMGRLKNIFALLGVAASAYFAVVFFNYVVPVAVTPQEDLFDWQTISTTWNSERNVVAVVEIGRVKTRPNTLPYYKVSLNSKMASEHYLNHPVVWEAQTNNPPIVSWHTSNELLLSQEPQPVSLYEPQVHMLSGTYKVLLKVNYTATGNVSNADLH